MVNMNNVNNEQWGEFSGLQETWSKTKACTAPGQRLKGADEISREDPFQAVPIQYMQLQHISDCHAQCAQKLLSLQALQQMGFKWGG